MKSLLKNIDVTVRDVLLAKTPAQSATLANQLGLSPYIINKGRKPAIYTCSDDVFNDSDIALPVGDIFIELKATTAAGIKQLHNIKKQFAIKTTHYKHKNYEHLLFYTDCRLLELPYDQLCIRSINNQTGLYINLKNSYAIIPPSYGCKLLDSYSPVCLPDDFVDYIIAMYENVTLKGQNYVRGA